ncbi:MAG: mechanosensitive ion channel domain-containing protein, partial [Candidatus Aenigmatarchaeota archaeon]
EGDFIIIGTDMGTVKHIGLKTTRITHINGQELIVSNRELTTARILNNKKMERRRIAFTFGVEYKTSVKKLKKIVVIVKDIFSKIKAAELDRVHFRAFGDFSLNFEVVYFINSQDFNVYMDTQQEINLQIKERFEKEKIDFAFPTQTIHLQK